MIVVSFFRSKQRCHPDLLFPRSQQRMTNGSATYPLSSRPKWRDLRFHEPFMEMFFPHPNSHTVIVRSPATLRRNPRNDLIRVHNVARLAMHAIRKINMNLPIHHLVHRRRAEMLARIPKLLNTTMVTNIRIANHQMHRLIIVVTRP
jgi:hypothetical protein